MKIVKEMPKVGQFVVCWSFDSKPWSGTFRYIEDQLCEINDQTNIWDKCDAYFNSEYASEVTYLVVGE